MKVLFIFLGTLFLGLGIIGIAIPGLPTTPFLLLSAACYIRSSDKLYNWLINHKIFGKYISNYRKNRALSVQHKIMILSIMWLMILLSAFLFIKILYLKLVVLATGIIGTIVILLIRPLKK